MIEFWKGIVTFEQPFINYNQNTELELLISIIYKYQ